MTGRSAELAGNLAVVRRRIEAACRSVDRDPAEVHLVVVTKFFPVSDVRLLAELGVEEVGENRHQEAESKAAECADLSLAWHFIGGLQSNKAAAVAAYTDVVESLDRGKLVGPLARGAATRARPLDVLLQVSLDPPDARGRAGAAPADLGALAAQVEAADSLALLGLMAIAPLGVEPPRAFAELAAIRRDFLVDHPQAHWLSAGMSADLEDAIVNGATHVRVGSAILGPRPSIK